MSVQGKYFSRRGKELCSQFSFLPLREERNTIEISENGLVDRSSHSSASRLESEPRKPPSSAEPVRAHHVSNLSEVSLRASSRDLPPVGSKAVVVSTDNGPVFTAGRVGVRTLFIEPGSPCDNGFIESFNGKLRDQLLNMELFDTLLEARVLTERWRRHDKVVRPHSPLNDRRRRPVV